MEAKVVKVMETHAAELARELAQEGYALYAVAVVERPTREIFEEGRPMVVQLTSAPEGGHDIVDGLNAIVDAAETRLDSVLMKHEEGQEGKAKELDVEARRKGARGLATVLGSCCAFHLMAPLTTAWVSMVLGELFISSDVDGPAAFASWRAFVDALGLDSQDGPLVSQIQEMILTMDDIGHGNNKDEVGELVMMKADDTARALAVRAAVLGD